MTLRSTSGVGSQKQIGTLALSLPVESWFDIVAIYADDPTGTAPTPSFPGSRDRVVCSLVLAVLPHLAGSRGIDGRAQTGRGLFHDWPLGTPLSP